MYFEKIPRDYRYYWILFTYMFLTICRTVYSVSNTAMVTELSDNVDDYKYLNYSSIVFLSFGNVIGNKFLFKIKNEFKL